MYFMEHCLNLSTKLEICFACSYQKYLLLSTKTGRCRWLKVLGSIDMESTFILPMEEYMKEN